MLACFATHALSFLSQGFLLPPKNPIKVFASLIYWLVGGTRPLEFCSPAVARAVMVCHIFCCSLFHVGIAVFIQSFRSFYFSPFLHSHRYCQPHARAVIHSLIAFHSTHFTFRVYVFSHPQIHVVAAVFRFTPHRFTTAHIHPFRSFAPIHSIRSLLPALAFSNAPFGQKNAPNQLPAAPVHRAPRFLCPGHSLHSQRLAHNAQAEYFVPFLYTRISALLSTLAQGCFYYSV